MRPISLLLCSLPLVLTACRGQSAADEPAPMAAPVRPLSALVSQQVIVVPLNKLREVDALGWTQQIPRSREYMRAFDDALEAELGARGLGTRWVYPTALVQAGRTNPSYSIDPYTIAASSLQGAKVVVGTRLGDPLVNQLRTMVALQETARAVLVPVELRFDKTADGRGVANLRLALLDGRVGEVRWIGDVRSTPSSTFSRELLTSLVAHTADLITAP